MQGLSDEESEFVRTLARIRDHKLRYFFMMLGEAIAENSDAQHRMPYVAENAGPEPRAMP
jgi:hypothetical protein